VRSLDVDLWGQGVSCIFAYPLPGPMSLLGELLTASRVQDLSRCRSLCGIPASTTRKKDLTETLSLHAQCPHKHRALFKCLTDSMTANGLRSWISSKRRVGFLVPDAKLMGRGRAEILDAIIRLDHRLALDGGAGAGAYATEQGQAHEEVQRQAASAGEFSSAAPVQRQAASAGEYSSAVEAAGGHSADASAGQSVGSHDVGMVLVAYDAGGSPAIARRKLGRKWLKAASRAYLRSHLPGRVRRAVVEALEENPDAVVSQLRGVVERKVGVDFGGKYRLLFDKALLRHAAQPEQRRRPRSRFVLAVGRQRAKRAPAS